MRLRTHDQVHAAKVDLIDVGGKNLASIARAPAYAWAVGLFLVFPLALALISAVIGYSLTTFVLAGAAAVAAGRWIGRETGGDHTVPDLVMSGTAELRSMARQHAARKASRRTRTHFPKGDL